MNTEQLNAIKKEYSNMNWEDFRENAGDLLTDEIDIYNTVVIDGVPVLIAEVERLREALSIYADEKRWVEPCTSTALVNGEPETVKDAPWAILDCGEYARQALGGETK